MSSLTGLSYDGDVVASFDSESATHVVVKDSSQVSAIPPFLF